MKAEKYETGTLSIYFKPTANSPVEKLRGTGKKAIDNFFHIMFMLLDYGYIQTDEIYERLENYKKTKEVVAHGYKRVNR